MKSSHVFFIILALFCKVLSATEVLELANSPEGRVIKEYTSSDFIIHNTNSQSISGEFLPNSFKWIRVNGVLLTPMARMQILVNQPSETLKLIYKNKVYYFQQTSNRARAEIEISLFEGEPIKILKSNKPLDEISWTRKSNKSEIYIDDTCSRNSIEIRGITTEAISLGCRIKKVGMVGFEKPTLEVTWISPELNTKSYFPLQFAHFTDDSPVKFTAINDRTKAMKSIEIRARVPKRIHRLFTAAGIGPYVLETKLGMGDKTEDKFAPLAPALFLYANYQLSENQSIRGFNAAVFNESVFDNAGIYLGSDFGFSFDNRLYFTTLIGVQYLYFKFDQEADVISEPIFPQGLEFMYRHAFDIPNYIVSGGFFLSTSSDVEYQNAWIRWGQKYFWELNYIGWGKDNFSAKMWGISLGFPLKGFL